jgi:hypothetical protein
MTIPTDLEAYQTEIVVDKLYYIKNSGRGKEREDSAIEVKGGVVNIYGSINRPTILPNDMTLDRTDFSGLDIFDYLPTFLYLTGTATEIYLSSVEVEEVV